MGVYVQKKKSAECVKCPDNVKSVRSIWKVSGQSGKCTDNLESVQTI